MKGGVHGGARGPATARWYPLRPLRPSRPLRPLHQEAARGPAALDDIAERLASVFVHVVHVLDAVPLSDAAPVHRFAEFQRTISGSRLAHGTILAISSFHRTI